MKNYHQKLEPGCFYHVYNRANGSEELFSGDYNYKYFLQKYTQYVFPIADTICYCLMPNHFHFLIKIKEEEDLLLYKAKAAKKSKSLENILSLQFSHFFNAYAQSYNKQQKRRGSLFMKNFNRLLITDEIYLRKIILYIHNNPVDAGIVNSIGEWKYSSYRRLSKGILDSNCSQSAIDHFGNLENFIFCHNLIFNPARV